MNSFRVAVIICVYNGRNFIKNCLEHILLQTYRDIDIIVIDDGSTDGTTEVLEDFKDNNRILMHCNKKNLGLMTSRNIGASMANAEIIAYTDVDCIVKPNWIEELIKPFTESRDIVIIGGKIDDPTPKSYWEYVMEGICFLSNKSKYSKKILGGNMAIKRDFLFNNKFDETLKYGGDETDLCIRALRQDYKIFYQNSAEVIHYHRNRFIPVIRQRFALGIGNYYVRLKHKIFPFVSVKSIDLVLASSSFLLWTFGMITFIFPVVFLILYIIRVFYEDRRTGRKKLYEVLFSLPGRVLIAIVEDIGYIWGIFWIPHLKRYKQLLK